MGLDQYLQASLPVGKGTPVWSIITNALTDGQKSELANEDYGYSTYVSGGAWQPEPDPLYALLVQALRLTPTQDSPSFTVCKDEEDYRVIANVGYWRKENAIHKWFVDNVQGGVDECQQSPAINPEQLLALRDLCNDIIAMPALAVALPTESGFFFGSTEYDDWYFQGLKATVEIIENVLKTPVLQYRGVTLHYLSSW